MYVGISLVFYFDMVYITLDKLLEILLNIKYPLYWNKRRTKILLLVTWCVSGVVVVVVSLLHAYLDFEWEVYAFKYCFPVLNFVFIVVACSSYSFIFYKFRQTRTPRKVGKRETDDSLLPDGRISKEKYGAVKTDKGVFQLIRRSRFFMIFLLIVTFLMFIVVPDLTYLFVHVINNKHSKNLEIACWILYAVGNLADCYIYIFLQPPVRKLLIKKISSRLSGQNI